jgi:two-component system response regulator HydG
MSLAPLLAETPGTSTIAHVAGAAIMTTVLIVDDDQDTCELVRDALRRRGNVAETVASGEAALEWLREREADVVVSDMQLGAMSGIDLCKTIAERRPDVPVIVVTGHGNMEVAIAAIRAGAYDFITKPMSLDALVLAVERAASHRQLRGEVRRLRQALDSSRRLDDMIGESPEIRKVFELVQQVAASDASVLITGESGTGKELVACAIHARSPRHARPFIAVNCAAMPATLLESELFGHVRGAFTDAKRDRPGLFVQASGSTLFLDEIGDMPAEMQVKLLRALQQRTVRPVGGDSEVPFDARLVTATNRDLDTDIEDGRFRADLFYRINVVSIAVPPLRSRPRDILLLAQSFLERQAARAAKPVLGITLPAAQKLRDYDWPGNVRELENCMERAVALTRTSEITVDDLPEKVREYQTTRLVITTDDPAEMVTLDEIERRYVRRVLAAVGGNKTQAAKVLGIDRRSLYRRIEPAERTGSLPDPE